MSEANHAVVRQYFDFLIHTCGFVYTPVAECVRYDSAELYVEIRVGQGDDEVLIGLKWDTPQIRPGNSHLFPFQKLLRHFHPKHFPRLAEFPRSPEQTSTEHLLNYYAHWIKKDLLPLLKGDLSILDAIAAK